MSLVHKLFDTPSYTHVHCLEITVTTGWKRGHSSWVSWATLSEPRSLGTGALFLISESGRGRGAQLLTSRPDYMGFAMQATTEWKRGLIWDNLATLLLHSLGTGHKCPPPPSPCFRVLFGKVQQCSILCDQTTGDLKSHHLQARGHSSICAPHLFFQQYMKKTPFLSAVHEKKKKPFLSAVHDFFIFIFFKGHSQPLCRGHVPLKPPLGSGIAYLDFSCIKKDTISFL